MASAKITVIVPVYNVAPYLVSCLESILAQTYRNLEIIVVDDGSTDGSGKICDDFQRQDSRIQVIHQGNGGLSAARNSGLDSATGDFITFVDSDDTIAADMLALLLRHSLESGADISSCRYCNVWEDGRCEYIGNDHTVRAFSDMEGLGEFLYGKMIDPFACGKLYQKSLIGSLRFKEGIVGEDVPFNFELFKKAKLVVLAGESKYLYLQKRPGAICNVKISKKRIDSALYWEAVRRECHTLSPQLEQLALRRQVLFWIGLYNRLYDEPKYREEAQYIQGFLKQHQTEIISSRVCEKTVKVATFLLAQSPFLYIVFMKLYKRVIGEARL